jgi:carotenoid cleavage dioxygenase-like enzyme
MDRRTFFKAAGGSAALGLGARTLTACTPSAVVADPLLHQGGLPTPTPGRDQWARIPRNLNKKVMTEISSAPLNVVDGAMPTDMAGHVFFESLALGPNDSGFSGDGMIWRVDFDGATPTITSKILRTTDYFMAQAFAGTPYEFRSHGMMRMGWLGIQNQSNTAISVLNGNRLLATSDGGRPWEFDPRTLDPITPIGRLVDYRPMMELEGFNQFVCPMYISSAHPPYDPRTGEFYGVSLSIVPVPGMVYCEILAWDGEGAIKRVPLVDSNGQPILITQNAHQLCVTRDYLIIVDASGTIEAGKLFDEPNSFPAGNVLTPRPDSYLYIVSRSAIRNAQGPVVAQRSMVARETGHFYVDYDNPPGRVIVHIPHTSANDFAEWIQPYDRHPRTHAPVRPELVNAITPVNYDIGVVSRFEIDAVSGRVVDQHAFFNDWTWGTGALTARNPLTNDDTLGDMYHANSGLPTDLAVERVSAGFEGYKYRLVDMDDLPWDGVPTNLVRIDHDAGSVLDGYFYPGDRFGWTVTFVPRNGTATGSADGYLVTVVFSDHLTPQSSGTEVWIFDAAHLANGPVARLGRPDLQVPLTLHSAWTDSLTVTRPDYRVDVRSELMSRAETWRLDPSVASRVDADVLRPFEAITDI